MKHRIRFLRRRREFISLVGVTALSPLMALAQQREPIIGHVHAGVAAANRNEVIAFEQGLKQRGYATGQSVQIQYLWAEGRYDQLPALVSELLDNHVNLIVAGTPVAAASTRRTSRIFSARRRDEFGLTKVR